MFANDQAMSRGFLFPPRYPKAKEKSKTVSGELQTKTMDYSPVLGSVKLFFPIHYLSTAKSLPKHLLKRCLVYQNLIAQ